MAIFTKDGLTLVPELADDAILTSNVLMDKVRGRNAISDTMLTMESFYSFVADVERTSLPGKELIISVALLPSTHKVRIHVVGLRDADGWISQVIMTHEPPEAVSELAALMAEALAA
jgi:hypothetical protein